MALVEQERESRRIKPLQEITRNKEKFDKGIGKTNSYCLIGKNISHTGEEYK